MTQTRDIRNTWVKLTAVYFLVVAFLILRTPMIPLLMMLAYSVACYFIRPVRHWRYFPIVFIMINSCFGTTTVLWLDYRKWFLILLIAMFFVDMCLVDEMRIGCFFYNKYFVLFYVSIIVIDVLSGGTYTIFSLIFEFLSLAMLLYEISSEKQLQDFLDMLIIANTVVACIGFYEFAIQDTFYYKRWTGANRYRYGIMRVGSTVEDPNFMCFTMVPTIPLIFYRFRQSSSKYYYLILQIIFISMTILTLSRIGLLTLLLGYFLLFYEKIQQKISQNRNLLNYMRFFFVVMLGSVLLYVVSKLSFNMSDDSFSGRYYVYMAAIQIVLEHPIWGLGFEKFAAAVEVILLRRFGMYNAIGFQNPMNTWLQVAVNGGLIALIPYVMTFIQSGRLALVIRARMPEYQELIKVIAVSFLQWFIISFTLDGMVSAIMWYLLLIPVILTKIMISKQEQPQTV